LRVVRPKGRILVYVWAFEQENKKYEAQDVLIPWHLQDKYGGKEKKVYKRYYHLFKEGELGELVKKTKCPEIIRTYYDHENWCIEFIKA